MTTATAFVLACSAVFVSAGGGIARQAPPGPAGHWIGTLAAGPGIDVEVDLAEKGPGVWHGTISIPTQGSKGIPLSELTVKGTAVSFAIKGGPGDPRFSGTLSADGKTISGTFSQGGGSLPLSLAWKGTVLRLVLKLANDKDGAKGVLISLDQGAIEIPLSTIAQTGSQVKFTVNMISGAFDGELKGGELVGTWTQGPLSLPLVLKRSAPSPPK